MLTETQTDRRLERERLARQEAEQLLERKSLELYLANQELVRARDEAEALVRLRTAELEAAVARASAMCEARSRFLAVMSHEIRTPISGVIGLLDLIADLPAGGERETCLASARTATAHLLELVNDVLDLAKIDAGKLVLVPAPFDPRALAEGVAILLRALVGPRDLRILVTAAPDLQAAVSADEHRLRQILMNLAGNAVKFTERGSVDIRLSTAPRPGGSTLRIDVKDTGPGIPLDQQALLFNEFVQADLMRHRHVTGTGLGLAICRRLAEAMGGRIGLESAPGQGSTFTVEVPVEPAEAKAEGGTAEPVRAAARARILLAEDTPTLQLVVSGFLRHAGHEVTVVGTGDDALTALRGGGYDLAVMDMFMPGMDGDEAIRRVRAGEAGPRDLPFIMLTAAIDEESITRATASGANQVLQKPVQRDELHSAVNAFLVRQPTSSTATA